MKFIDGGLYARGERECVLIEKQRTESGRLVVKIKFVGTKDIVVLPSNLFDRQYRFIKGAGKHVRIKGWKRR